MKLVMILTAFILLSPFSCARAAVLDPNMPYMAAKSNPVSYAVDFSVVVTPPYHTKVLKVWLPLPQSDAGQEVSKSRLSTFPMKVTPRIGTEKRFGNKFAYFEFHAPRGGQVIRHRFTIKVWELHWNIKADKVVTVNTWPKSFDHYRQSDSQAVVVDSRFTNLLGQIVPERGNPLHDLSEVMNWVIKDFKYDHTDASLQASSVFALTKRHGHCSDYHSFCASMGRALGYPTRVTYGIAATPKNSPSHCKLEAYLPPYGWVSFDVSETQKLLAAIHADTHLDARDKNQLTKRAIDRLTAGFRENTWFLQTKGTDYDLEPPASRRVAVVRTAYIEADGERLPEPDPANKNNREFSWMTVQQYVPDRPVTNPMKDIRSLGAVAK